MNEQLTENQRLKFFRGLKNCTQQQFADLANIKQGSYADQERGKVKVSGDVKLALFKEFSLNIDWLETGEGEMYAPDYKELVRELESRLEEYERSSTSIAADSDGYRAISTIDWQKRFLDIDEKYRALLENRLFEFLNAKRIAGGSA